MKTQNNKAIAPNARFWTWENDGWVKLTLRVGQVVTWGRFSRDDEGWSSEASTWEHTGYGVKLDWLREGRDCDGRVSDGGGMFAPLDELKAVPAFCELDGVSPCAVLHDGQPIRRPEWRKVGEALRRDYSAEAAGY